MQAEESVDLVVGADVFPYIRNLKPVFAAAQKALKKGTGLLAFSCEEFYPESIPSRGLNSNPDATLETPQPNSRIPEQKAKPQIQYPRF